MIKRAVFIVVLASCALSSCSRGEPERPRSARGHGHAIDHNDFPNVRRWYTAIAAREPVKRGFNVPKEAEIPMP